MCQAIRNDEVSQALFVHQIGDLIDSDNSDDALELLFADENETIVEDACMDLFSALANRLNSKNISDSAWSVAVF